jgi:hypothetical protein
VTRSTELLEVEAEQLWKRERALEDELREVRRLRLEVETSLNALRKVNVRVTMSEQGAHIEVDP